MYFIWLCRIRENNAEWLLIKLYKKPKWLFSKNAGRNTRIWMRKKTNAKTLIITYMNRTWPKNNKLSSSLLETIDEDFETIRNYMWEQYEKGNMSEFELSVELMPQNKQKHPRTGVQNCPSWNAATKFFLHLRNFIQICFFSW